ncbi:MAG: signal peptide peptidase SppA [Pseudomonadota bacterium]
MTELSSGSGRSRVSAWSFLKGLAKVVVGGALLLQAVLFIAVFVLVISLLGAASDGMNGKSASAELEIEAGSTLYFNPKGLLGETTPEEDPLEEALNEAFGGGSIGQISVHKLVKIIETARDDEDISGMVLDLQGLAIPDIYLSKANLLADAIEDFRESGKEVIAVGDGYGQNQYLVASEANKVMMHHQGSVFMVGYGRYRTYYASLLEMLDVTTNVFRVGTFKSALEPVLRDDMSPEAEEANVAYLSVLWDNFTARVDENRDLGQGATDFYTKQVVEIVRAARGDLAVAAQDSGYVDQLVTRAELRDFYIELAGEDEDGNPNFVDLGEYKSRVESPEDRDDIGNVAVITVEGAIVDGAQETGVASGEFVSRQLRRAREDDDVKAVVLRVDSPGGSVFASELIRNEVQAIQAAGKPVVASMSSLAASGGYWISSPADAIWAQETTLTGSIGIFAYIPTFEKLAARYGVFTDGVGTGPMAAMSAAPIGPLPEESKLVIQNVIENGYRQFLDRVSEGRDIPLEEVAEIAEGRVWIGADAKDINLVDAFGGLDDAIADAAARADLEEWDVVGMGREKTRFEQFLESLGAEAEARGLISDVDGPFGVNSDNFDRTTLGQAIEILDRETRFQASFSDPNDIYVRCLECTVY